ncbi:uncharacterized protein BDW43DRAFT_263613, partial [Aspergillus alliaceus]|uniref:uncharacterized protein n=1 Tax=Petromyces alliaceus TaxID=209559 RepID=UPI0012A51182
MFVKKKGRYPLPTGLILLIGSVGAADKTSLLQICISIIGSYLHSLDLHFFIRSPSLNQIVIPLCSMQEYVRRDISIPCLLKI